ncbi:hypothetical protein LINPERHAP2_LOCUS108 [Linum perenne]
MLNLVAYFTQPGQDSQLEIVEQGFQWSKRCPSQRSEAPGMITHSWGSKAVFTVR